MPLETKGRRIALAILFACLAAALAALAALSSGEKAPVWRFVALAIAAHAPYAAIVALSVRAKAPPLLVLSAAAALRLVLVAGEPVFSDDVYRYVWDGRVVAAGMDPYAFPPAAEELARFRDSGFEHINNKELRTIYPPLAQVVFGAVAAVSPTPRAFRLVAALADVGVVFLLMSIVRLRAGPEARAPAAVGIAYGLNPLACVETAMSGHLEPLAVLPVAAAAALFVAAGTSRIPQRIARIGAAAALAAGCGIKLVPVLFVAPFVRRLRAIALVVPLALAGMYAAFWSPETGALRTLDAFARRWEGNAGGFALIEAGARRAIGAAAGVERPDEMVHVPVLDRASRALEGTFFSLHKDGGFDPARPGAFPLSDLSLAAAKLVALAALVCVIAWTVRRRLEPTAALLWIGGAFALLTPVMHPWYLLWLLPWAACNGALPWFVFGAALPLAYLPLDGWWSRGVWEAPFWIPLVEYGVLAIAAAWWLTGKAQGSRNSL
jgi:hypothetical protein